MTGVSCVAYRFLALLVVYAVLGEWGCCYGNYSVEDIRKSALAGGSSVHSAFHFLSDKALGEGHGLDKDPRRRLAAYGASFKEYVFVMEVYFGTPEQKQLLSVDTGSSFTWLQCVPCTGCPYAGDLPIYDPSKSSSVSQVLCSDTAVCQETQGTCYAPSQACPFQNLYADATGSKGTFAREVLTLVTTQGVATPFHPFYFGCANSYISDYFPSYSGTLGLGRGIHSVVTQAKLPTFSYCLPKPNLGFNTQGVVAFGYTNLTTFAYTLLISRSSTSYYIDIVGISVNGELLAIPPTVFEYNPLAGSEGSIIDSGVFFTYLKERAYSILRNSFISNIVLEGSMALVPAPNNDACFDINIEETPSPSSIPTISIHLRSWASTQQYITLNLPPANVIYLQSYVTAMVVRYCLAFSTFNTTSSILGIYQQLNFLIEYDIANERLGFLPCTA